ncbi:MAG: hypothetical protein ABR988_01455 [Terriglobales bacterium]|jgi:hypothetical protein
MARKTTGSSTTSSTTSRSKKTAASIQPAAVQVASEVPKNGKPSNLVVVDLPVNLEEEIRRRAYELYLQRRATAGNENVNGDENTDWLIAEREIRLRYGNQERRRA